MPNSVQCFVNRRFDFVFGDSPDAIGQQIEMILIPAKRTDAFVAFRRPSESVLAEWSGSPLR